MTRKDFQLIADVIAQFQIGEGKAMVSPSLIAGAMADALEDENPRFDREKFLRACGINPIFTERMFSKEGVML